MYLDPNETEELCADRTTEHVYKIPRVRWERLLGCFDVLPHFSRTIHNTFERLHTQILGTILLRVGPSSPGASNLPPQGLSSKMATVRHCKHPVRQSCGGDPSSINAVSSKLLEDDTFCLAEQPVVAETAEHMQAAPMR